MYRSEMIAWPFDAWPSMCRHGIGQRGRTLLAIEEFLEAPGRKNGCARWLIPHCPSGGAGVGNCVVLTVQRSTEDKEVKEAAGGIGA